jgi:hypothetical protein
MFKFKIKTSIAVLILAGLFFTGCPPQKQVFACSIKLKNKTKQTYVTGIESGRGELYTFSIIFDCIDSIKIDSITLNDNKEEFEIYRNQLRINSIYPQDSVVMVVNHFELNSATPKANQKPNTNEITVFYGSKKFKNKIYVSEFEKGPTLMNP